MDNVKKMPQLQRIAFQKVWCEEMTEEQIMGELGVSQQD